MQLRDARICLDCEELHTEAQCPICTSEAFAYLTRWVPSEARNRPRAPSRAAVTAPVARKPASRWVKRGAAGLALVAVGRMLWRSTQTTPGPDAKSE